MQNLYKNNTNYNRRTGNSEKAKNAIGFNKKSINRPDIFAYLRTSPTSDEINKKIIYERNSEKKNNKRNKLRKHNNDLAAI